MKKPHNRSPTPTSRATSSSEALSGGNSRATALFLKLCPYRANSRPRLCPRVRGSIEATSILTQGDGVGATYGRPPWSPAPLHLFQGRCARVPLRLVEQVDHVLEHGEVQ